MSRLLKDMGIDLEDVVFQICHQHKRGGKIRE